MADSDNDSSGAQDTAATHSELSSLKEQDRFLPIANVSRIMKRALPANAKISKDAKETVQECVSEFISFITGEASDKCQREKRKTINGDDLLWAITSLGFEDYVDPLKLYLHRLRELEGDKTLVMRDKEASPPPPLPGPGGGGGGGVGVLVGYGGGGGGGGSGSVQYHGHVYGSGGFHHMGVGKGGGNFSRPR